MGSLGFSEIILILVVGFLIFGPEKLPKMLRNIGKSLKKLLDVKDDIQSSLNDVQDTINDTEITDTEINDSMYRIEKKVRKKNTKNNDKKLRVNKRKEK